MIDRAGRFVEQSLRIEASRETVWRYWTDPERMCTWWAESADLDARPGGRCIADLGGGAIMRGEYLEVVPYERIVFTFGWDPHPDAPAVPPGSSRVQVTFIDDAGDTIMTLRHTDIPPDELGRHDDGWTHFLGRFLEAVSNTTES
jgi:uncharacterized protein YndB with AHSA1/START domain